MQIDLRPHVGKSMASGRDIDLRQDRIFVDGQHVGYVGRKADAPINLIYPDMPEEQVQAIRDAVIAKHGGTAPKVAAPAAVPDDVQDADPDDLD